MSLFLVYAKTTESWVAPMTALLWELRVTQGSLCVALPPKPNVKSCGQKTEGKGAPDTNHFNQNCYSIGQN